MKTTGKLFGYVRLSGDSQLDGDGFPRQEAAIRDYADWGSGAPGSLLRKRLVSYASLSNNILDPAISNYDSERQRNYLVADDLQLGPDRRVPPAALRNRRASAVPAGMRRQSPPRCKATPLFKDVYTLGQRPPKIGVGEISLGRGDSGVLV